LAGEFLNLGVGEVEPGKLCDFSNLLGVYFFSHTQ
jgi:hypothetical protein